MRMYMYENTNSTFNEWTKVGFVHVELNICTARQFYRLLAKAQSGLSAKKWADEEGNRWIPHRHNEQIIWDRIK